MQLAVTRYVQASSSSRLIVSSPRSSGSYTYIYEGLTNDQAYMFRVRAVNFYGFSAPAVIGPVSLAWELAGH